jgi:hypothetical protein
LLRFDPALATKSYTKPTVYAAPAVPSSQSNEFFRLAREIFALVSTRLARDGLQPGDPEVGHLLAAMIAAHYAVRGRSAGALREILTDVLRCIGEAAGR